MIAEALAGMFAATTIDPIHPRDPALAKMLGLGSRVESGVRVDEETVLGFPPFWRGVNIICNGVAKPRLNVYERVSEQDREKAKGHPSYPLLAKRAHMNCGASSFRRLLQSHALLWGNGFAWIQRNGGGEPMGLYPLPPDKTVLMRFKGDQKWSDLNASDGDLLYVTELEGNKFSVEPENMLHIRGLGYNEYWGYAVVDMLKEAIGLGMAAQRYGARFFGSGATPSALIMAPPNMKPEQVQEFGRAIKDKIQGLGKSHTALVVGHGTEYQQLSLPPDHAQMLQTREFEVRDIANVIGVQPHKLGDPSRKSYNSLEQSNQEHLDDDLDPWLGVWEEEANEKMLTEEQKATDSHYVEFNREALMRTNLAAQTAHLTAGRQWGAYSANDWRRKYNLPPVDGGDLYLSPGNMVPADQAGVITQMDVDGEPNEPPQEDDSSRDAVLQLTRHEVERLAMRAAKAAMAAAKKGGKEYCAFLEKLRGWGKEPACIAPALGAAVERLHANFNAFAEPPYKAADLAANVTEAAEKIAESVINHGGGEDA